MERRRSVQLVVAVALATQLLAPSAVASTAATLTTASSASADSTGGLGDLATQIDRALRGNPLVGASLTGVGLDSGTTISISLRGSENAAVRAEALRVAGLIAPGVTLRAFFAPIAMPVTTPALVPATSPADAVLTTPSFTG